jgi:hypothetical protein
MRVTSWSETIDRYIADGLTVSGGKEDDSAALAKKAQAENTAKANARLAAGQGYEKSTTDSTKDWLTGNVGFSPEMLSMLISQFQNNTSQQEQSAGNEVRSALQGRGSTPSDAPVGGDFVRNLSALKGLFASSRATGIKDIGIQNLMQALQNKQFAVNLRAGLAQNAGNQALGWGQQANQNITQVHDAFRPGFFENLGNSFAKAIPGVAMGLATGGLSGVLSGASAGMGGLSSATINAARTG